MRYMLLSFIRYLTRSKHSVSPQVTRTKKWADLGRLLGYGGIPGLATQMKNSYARVILPYEHFCERVKNSPNMSPGKYHDHTLKTHVNIQSAGRAPRANNGTESVPSSPLTDSDSELSSVPDESDQHNTRPRRSARQVSSDPTMRKCLLKLAATSCISTCYSSFPASADTLT